MKKLITVIAIGALAGGAAAPVAVADPRPMVVGGEVDELPNVGWIAALSERGQYTCSGSLVAPRIVLTAAHCTQRTRARHWTVRLDSKDRTDGGVVRRVRRILTFPRYRWFDDYGDVALLRLREGVDVEPVRLVPRGIHWTGSLAYIAGWGQTAANVPSVPRWLHSAWIPIQPDGVCIRRYSRWGFNGRVMLCAGERRPSACMGDSGGPLAGWVDGAWHLVGVTSFGTPRCDRPGAYAWVGSKPLRRWLRTRLGR